MSTKIVKITEWDGDRSSALGGFNIKIVVCGEVAEIRGPSFEDKDERDNSLLLMRNKGRRIAEAMGCEVTEELL